VGDGDRPATGALVQDAHTPAIKWTASRSAGRVYAGTVGSQPIVETLTARRTEVSTVLFSCYATDTTPAGMILSATQTFRMPPTKYTATTG
jgi:hypothetical protein